MGDDLFTKKSVHGREQKRINQEEKNGRFEKQNKVCRI